MLDVSPVHLLRYQDAAEKAVRAVIPKRPRVSIQERRTGRQITEKLKLYQELLGKSARLDGDALVLYLRNPDYIPCATAAGAGGRPISRPGLGLGGEYRRQAAADDVRLPRQPV